MVRLTAPQTYMVITYLLAHQRSSQIEISRAVGASRNLVNHVVKELEAPGIVEQRAKGHLELKDPLRLLEVLSTERPLSRLVVKEIRTEESEVSKVERMVRNAAAVHNGAYALTAFSALSKYIEYYITYPMVHVYSDRPLELSDHITAGRGDVTVQILRPDSEAILRDARQVKEFNVVEPVQVVIDLFCGGGAGRDGAMKLYAAAADLSSSLTVRPRGRDGVTLRRSSEMTG
ncbi:MAG: winged helix-turn-helix domain-containing protein [Thaumarchaeota archaeon]|nr:winged helix-turn-helix domain-containing protein [Nitrososphaerota archaeon]MCL5317261.1 winged helix-turn-helix domain-containing protein [Nitrososphaerota archaeon]